MIPKSPDGMRRAVFAGSFNPITLGHMSVLQRGLELFDHVTVVIGINDSKPDAEADTARRVAEVEAAVAGLKRVDVMAWNGLTADAAKKCGARWLLRGVRSVADFEYERNMADVNRMISDLETVILFAEPQLAAVSSSVVRELKHYGYDTGRFLPPTNK